MEGEGFKSIYNMLGGIRAWAGFVAEGVPEAGMAYFTVANKPEELIALAWVLEEGSRKFYSEIPALVSEEKTKKLFHDLATAEEHHKASLVTLYKTITGTPPVQGFPGSIITGGADGEIMEGGMRISEALKWVKGKNTDAIFELAIALETNAYDLYIKMRQRMQEDKSRRVFDQLALEEKKHLDLLAALFDNERS